MSWSNYADTRSCTELLTYLVVSQLLRHHLTGKWLTAEHAAEFTHLWMYVNGPLDLLARVSLAGRSEALAAKMLRESKQLFDAKALAEAFVDSGHLDYRSPVVVAVHQACRLQVTSAYKCTEHQFWCDAD
ncbi:MULTISPECIES: hypothetical protein [Paraburkholderia]|jgi:hypothetical protein|uniref:hypothetical protein n=1 Tax=Paraburkholderia TaxID=1822464 RepID=UPI0038BB3EA7